MDKVRAFLTAWTVDAFVKIDTTHTTLVGKVTVYTFVINETLNAFKAIDTVYICAANALNTDGMVYAFVAVVVRTFDNVFVIPFHTV